VQVKIPTLCYHPDLRPGPPAASASCATARSPKLLRACCTDGGPGMKITTHDPEIVQIRRSVLELILSTHPNDCLQCPRNGNCELQKIAADFGIRDTPYPNRAEPLPRDESTPSIVLNPEKCIKCGRCALVCQEMQNVWALEFIGRGEKHAHRPRRRRAARRVALHQVRPVLGPLPRRRHLREGRDRQGLGALKDPASHCVVQIAPAVRVAIGESFGLEPGTLMTGKDLRRPAPPALQRGLRYQLLAPT
jgi:ferredoxin